MTLMYFCENGNCIYEFEYNAAFYLYDLYTLACM